MQDQLVRYLPVTLMTQTTDAVLHVTFGSPRISRMPPNDLEGYINALSPQADPENNELEDIFNGVREMDAFIDTSMMGLEIPSLAPRSRDSLGFLVAKLAQLDTFMSNVSYVMAYRSILDRGEGPPPEGTKHTPIVIKVSQNSPLLVDLATSGSVAASVIYLFKNPDKIGSFFPDIITGYYNGVARARAAKKAAAALYRAGAEITLMNSGEEPDGADS